MGGKKFTSSEQAYMYNKAIFFDDELAANNILLTNSPLQAKKLGRTVKNFDELHWKASCNTMMYLAVLSKFMGNNYLRTQLLGTNKNTLAEASPTDLIWGIGLSEKDEKAGNPNNWVGNNLLGKTLMKIRELI